MGLRKLYKRFVNNRAISKSKQLNIDLELERVYLFPANKVGFANLFERPFKFHDGKSFVATYKELFQCDIYKFNASADPSVILDCGANMGLSVLYFAKNYPNHTIIAFEPDEIIFDVLKENVETFKLKNVELHQKAVWVRPETLPFYTDGGMGGRIDNVYKGREPKTIEAIPLLDFLTENVDFLKLDIEGAEDEVLKYCDENLKKAKHIFFEYHNNINGPQTLHELLDLVKRNGFHYYIKESATRQKPFVDNTLICESFDMAINVFCYKQ